MSEATMPFEFVLLAGTGLAISLGHCIGMCGPLVGAVSVSQRSDGAGSWTLFWRLLVYHGGRLSSYMLLGAGLGLLGSATLLTDDGKAVQGGLSVLVGLLMLLLGIGLLGWLPTQRWLESGRVQNLVAGRLRSLLDARTAPRRWTLGMANGFLPCGPVYTVAMTAAATGSPWKGALAMLFFGLGTVPVLLALGLGAAGLSVARRRFFNRLGAALVLAMALQLVLRGLAAWGLVAHLRYGEIVIW
jgi:sulfite exporter TauE/SafE